MSKLPIGWTTATIPELAEILDSRRIPLNAAERANRRGPFPYYGANGRVDSIDDYLFDGPHVLVAEDGGYFDQPERGVAYIVDGKFWVNNHAHILRPREGIDPHYLLHAVNATNWMPHVGGTTRLKLTQAALGEPALPVAPSTEQRRIVAKLDALSARSKRARAELERVEALAVRAKQAVLDRLVGHQAQGDWEFVPLGELITDGPRNGWSPPSGDDATGALTLKLSATTGGELLLTPRTTKRIYEVPPAGSNFWLITGDILIQRANTLDYVGTTVIFEGPANTYIYPDLMMRIRIADPDVRDFVAFFLNSPTAKSYFRVNATGTAGNMPKINGSTVRNLMIPLPRDRVMIKKRVDQAKLALATIKAVQTSVNHSTSLLARLDASILSLAFRGELVPQNPIDEPASNLLDRVRSEREAGGSAPKRRRRAE